MTSKSSRFQVSGSKLNGQAPGVASSYLEPGTWNLELPFKKDALARFSLSVPGPPRPCSMKPFALGSLLRRQYPRAGTWRGRRQNAKAIPCASSLRFSSKPARLRYPIGPAGRRQSLSSAARRAHRLAAAAYGRGYCSSPYAATAKRYDNETRASQARRLNGALTRSTFHLVLQRQCAVKGAGSQRGDYTRRATIAPARSNRSGGGGNEAVEASGGKGPTGTRRAGRPQRE